MCLSRSLRLSVAFLSVLYFPSSLAIAGALLGQITFSDGSPYANRVLKAEPRVGSAATEVTTDALGNYFLSVPDGSYDLIAAYSVPGFTGVVKLNSAVLEVAGNVPFSGNVPDLTLNGRIVDQLGNPVPNIQFGGVRYDESFLGDTISVNSGPGGLFTVQVLPGTYRFLELTPPAGAPYVPTSLLDTEIREDATLDFVIWNAVTLSGRVTFSDGSPCVGATIRAEGAAGSLKYEGTTDANGEYAILLPGGEYHVVAVYSVSGFFGTIKLDTDPVTVGVSPVTFDAVIPDITLNGRIVDQFDNPVSQVHLSAVRDGDGVLGDVLSVVSGATGSFSVQILPGIYRELLLTPLPGTTYVPTSLPDTEILTDGNVDFLIQSAVALSGRIAFSDGSPCAGATLRAKATLGGLEFEVTTDADGEYSMILPEGDYDFFSLYSVIGFSGEAKLNPAAVSIQGNADTYDAVVPDVVLSGQIVDQFGNAVPNVNLVGIKFGTHLLGDILNVTSGADGSFTVRLLPGTYRSVRLTPAEGAGYSVTLLPDLEILANESRNFEIAGTRGLDAFLRDQIIDQDKAGPFDDADGNGIPNAVEYFLKTDGNDPSEGDEVVLAGVNPIKIRYPKGKGRNDVIGQLVWTTDLSSGQWFASGESNDGLSVVINEVRISSEEADPEVIEATLVPSDDTARLFFQLRVRVP